MTNEIFQLIIKSETAHIIESEPFFKDNLCYIYDINNLKFNDFINTKGGFITTIFDFINNDINIKTINYKIILTTCSNMPYNIQIECKLDNNKFYNKTSLNTADTKSSNEETEENEKIRIPKKTHNKIII